MNFYTGKRPPEDGFWWLKWNKPHDVGTSIVQLEGSRIYWAGTDISETVEYWAEDDFEWYGPIDVGEDPWKEEE